MELNEEQKAQVISWVQEGIGLSDIQARLKVELGLSLTFMEVRFLIDDLDLTLAEKKPPQKRVEPAASDHAAGGEADSGQQPAPDDSAMDAGGEWHEPDAVSGGGSVTVDVDRLQKPGAVVSGNVTFSDGERMAWQIDQMGRLGLVPGKEGYRPSEADLTQFQAALQAQLQKQGF